MKRCTECRQPKPADQFYRQAAAADGLTSQCKECRKKRDRARYVSTRAAALAYQQQYRQTHASEMAQKRKGLYARMTPEQRKRKLANNHRWLRRHPEKNANYVAKRRARIANAPVVELIDRQVVYTRDRGTCHLCGKQVAADDFHLDHVVPLVKGGEHSYQNVRVACPTCNAIKGARCGS